MTAAILALALLGAQVPPAATSAIPPATVPAAAPAKVAADDEDKIVCKKQETTGSRFATRICHTKAQWVQIEKDSRDMLSDQQSQSYRNPSNGH
jgi:hypothetical protein